MEIKKRKMILTILFVGIIVLMYSACWRTNKKWWDYGDDWLSENQMIRFYDDVEEGWIIVFCQDGISENYNVSLENNGSKIYAYIYEAETVSEDLFVAYTKYMDGKLYMTVIEDKIYGMSEGTVIVFNQVQEENEEEQP